jgi:ribosomal protein S18 acetylase RimI-like enzyme
MPNTATTSTKSSVLDTAKLVYRPPTSGDLNDLADVDLKCFPWNWTTETWGIALGDCVSSIVYYDGLPIALATMQKQEDDAWVIGKIGVKKEFRGHGIGSRLMRAAMGYAQHEGAIQLICTLPESQCYPGQADLGPWIKKHGFRATGMLRDHYCIDGEYEDGIVWRRFV